MRKLLSRWCACLAVVAFALSGQFSFAEPIPVAQIQRNDQVSFEKEIFPILQRNCLACHSASEKQGDIVLESPQGILKGGDNGPAAIPGRGADSLIVKLAAHQSNPVMPPDGNDVAAKNLSSNELGLLKLWIDQGAKGADAVASLSPKNWQPLPPGNHPVQALALTEDGQFIAAGRANQIFLYHVPTGSIVTRLSDPALNQFIAKPTGAAASEFTGIAHRDLVQSLTFNADGDLLASGSFREVKLWRRPRDVTKYTLDLGEGGTAIAVSPDKAWLAIATAENKVRLYSAADGKPGPVLEGHTGSITSLRFAPDGTRLLSGSQDQTVRLWDAQSGTAVAVVDTPAPVNAIELVNVDNPTEQQPHPAQWLVTGHADNMIRVWELPANSSPSHIAGAEKLLLATTTRDASLMASVSEQGNVRVVTLRASAGQPAGHEIATWQISDGVTAATFARLPEIANPQADTTAQTHVLVTGNSNGLIRVWSLPDHKLLREFRSEASPVTALSTSHDGRLLTSGLETGGLTQWDMAAVLQSSGDDKASTNSPVIAHTLSPSRKLLAVAGTHQGQPAVFVQNTENKQLVATLTGHSGLIRTLAFSKNETQLLSGSDDKSVRIWNLQAPSEAPKTVAELPAAVTAVGANDDVSQVLVGFADNALRLYNANADSPETLIIKEFSGNAGPVIAVGTFGGQFYSVSADKSVRFWNPADGAQTRAFNLPTAITAFAQSSDGQRLVFAGDDRQIRVIQTDNGNTLQTLNGFAQPITSVSLSADGQQLAAVTNNGELSDWNVPGQHVLEVLPTADLALAQLTQAGAPLATVSRQGQLDSWTMVFQRRFDGIAQPITALEYHPNGQVLFTTAADGSFRGYNTQNAQQTFATSHGAKVLDLGISSDGNILATAGENSQVRLWNSSGGGVAVQQISGLPGPATRVAFSADNSKVIVATGGEHPVSRLYDFQSGQFLEQFDGGDGPVINVEAAPLRPDVPPTGQKAAILVASITGTKSWEPSYLRTVPGHGGPVNALAAIPENPKQVFAGSTDTTIRRWNLESGQAMQQFNHGGPVNSIAVRPDGQRLASASENHTAKLFNVNGQQIAEMRGDVRRRIAQTRAQQQLTASNARLNAAKQLLQQAEQDLPTRTNAEKTLADNLAKANEEVTKNEAALEKARQEKLVAEKAALDATSKAKEALAEKETAELAARAATAAMQLAQTTMQRLQQASNIAPANEELKTLLAKAMEELTRCQQESQTATAAVQAPTQKAQEMATLANTAAQTVTGTQKPFTDALTALKMSLANQNLLAQQHVLAAQELKVAQDLVPTRKELVTQAEAMQVQAQEAVNTANTAAQEADLAIRSVTFSPDGATLLTAGEFASAHLWDAETGTALTAFAAHTAPLQAAAFTEEGMFVSISADKTARLWEVSPGWTLERTIGSVDDSQTISHRVTSVDFNADASRLLFAGGVPSRNGELQVYDIADGKVLLSLPQAHDDVIYSARFSPDGRHIASGGADKYLRTFDIESGQQLHRFEGHTNYVLGVDWKGNGQLIVSAGADNTVKVWEAESADQQRTIENQFARHVTSVQYIGETDSIVTSCGDKLVRFHNASNGGLERNFGDIQVWPHCVACTPDRSIVAAGDASGTITIWNGQNGQLLRKMETPSAEPSP
ncbi:MAG: hypothetical protein KDA88_18225 [Planctomycetaceae bacterium]|nr:hypothetical protein [Planctomycetaceae bacterium]MCB9952240.1 hypothetical protein [Planctomycetaceae bacterium]